MKPTYITVPAPLAEIIITMLDHLEFEGDYEARPIAPGDCAACLRDLCRDPDLEEPEPDYSPIPDPELDAVAAELDGADIDAAEDTALWDAEEGASVPWGMVWDSNAKTYVPDAIKNAGENAWQEAAADDAELALWQDIEDTGVHSRWQADVGSSFKAARTYTGPRGSIAAVAGANGARRELILD